MRPPEDARDAGLAWRIVLSALLAAYLFAVWGSGFDRMSAAAPSLERLVPAPLRAQADRSAAAMALVRGDSAIALAIAGHAVRSDPLDPLADSLLGSARQYQGDPAGAEAAFRVAAQRGWRDRLTQLYWFDAAMRTGDVERAALRADALLRSDPDFAAAGTLLKPLEASEAGRAALARRLAGRPVWAGAYFNPEGDADTLRLKAQIAGQAAAQGGPLGCETLRPLAAALLDRGMRHDAEAMWRANCPAQGAASAAPGGLTDGGFEHLSGEAAESPFGWRKYARGDLTIEPVELPGGMHALSLANGASVSRIVLSQALGLAPGRYRLRGEIRAGGQPATGRIAISLDCNGQPRRPDRIVGDPAISGQIFEVGACNSQILGIWLRPGSALTIDNLTLERLR